MKREWPPGGDMVVVIMLLFLVEGSQNVLSPEFLVEFSSSDQSLSDLGTLEVAKRPCLILVWS